MQDALKSLDLKDLQLVIGISMLGYGLYLVYPPAMFIAIGSLFLAPFVIPMLRGAKQ